MTSEDFAAQAGSHIVDLFHHWLLHTWTQAQLLRSDPPADAPAGLAPRATGVIEACERLHEHFHALHTALGELGTQVPPDWDGDEAWPP
jgi:hypothetical protein